MNTIKIYIMIIFTTIFINAVEYTSEANKWSLLGAIENIKLDKYNNSNCLILKFIDNKYKRYNKDSNKLEFSTIYKKEGFWLYGSNNKKCTLSSFDCKSDGRKFNLEIKATFCSYSGLDEGRFWERGKGLYNTPASEKSNQFSIIKSNHAYYCGVHPESFIKGYGGVSPCYEAHVMWDYIEK